MSSDMQHVPQLLIGEYGDFDGLADLICNNRFRPLDTQMPTCRFRGTAIRKNDADGSITITGWQRNVTRLQKMDVSLPAIITAVVRRIENGEGYRVESIELDRRFKGSRGILCSASYLDRNMKAAVTGQVFDRSLLKMAKLPVLHCFHFVEIIYAMVSWFANVKSDVERDAQGVVFFEEETIDYLDRDGRESCGCGIQLVRGKSPVPYLLVLSDLFERVGFSKEAAITCTGSLDYEFSVAGGPPVRETICSVGNNLLNISFQKMLLGCIKKIQVALGVDEGIPMYFTNLYPPAFIGLLTQMLAVRHFGNNYQYIMHVLSGLQRHDNVPLCIGSALNLTEVKHYFPGFSPNDLKG